MVKRVVENRMAEMILITVISLVLLSSCSSSKMYHVGTGNELSKSNCTGNYIYK